MQQWVARVAGTSEARGREGAGACPGAWEPGETGGLGAWGGWGKASVRANSGAQVRACVLACLRACVRRRASVAASLHLLACLARCRAFPQRSAGEASGMRRALSAAMRPAICGPRAGCKGAAGVPGAAGAGYDVVEADAVSQPSREPPPSFLRVGFAHVAHCARCTRKMTSCDEATRCGARRPAPPLRRGIVRRSAGAVSRSPIRQLAAGSQASLPDPTLHTLTPSARSARREQEHARDPGARVPGWPVAGERRSRPPLGPLSATAAAAHRTPHAARCALAPPVRSIRPATAAIA